MQKTQMHWGQIILGFVVGAVVALAVTLVPAQSGQGFIAKEVKGGGNETESAQEMTEEEMRRQEMERNADREDRSTSAVGESAICEMSNCDVFERLLFSTKDLSDQHAAASNRIIDALNDVDAKLDNQAAQLENIKTRVQDIQSSL